MKTQFFFNDLNDTQKQQLADLMLNDHPVRLQNCIVEYILSKSWEDTNAPFSYDDITNYSYYGSVEIGGYWEELTEDERDQKLELYEHLRDRADRVFDELEELQREADQEYDDLQEKIDRWEPVKDKYQTICENLESMDFDEKPEIYQWFSCSDWLIRELEEHGQCTVDNEFWGRQCCGQSITLDHVIQNIAFNYACDYGKAYLTAGQVGAL